VDEGGGQQAQGDGEGFHKGVITSARPMVNA